MTLHNHSTRRAVEDAYRRTKGPVAFLDESYQAPDLLATQADRATFYIFTAVVVDLKDMDALRNGLATVARTTYWHTTNELQTNTGRQRTRELLNFLAEGPEPCVIAHRVAVDPDDINAEQARRDCYRGLAIELAAGRPNAWSPIDLIVLEERNEQALKARDQSNHRALLVEKRIPRNTRLLQTSPACDRLLWLPDLVSSAFRRTITHNDNTSTLFTIIKNQVYFVTPISNDDPR